MKYMRYMKSMKIHNENSDERRLSTYLKMENQEISSFSCRQAGGELDSWRSKVTMAYIMVKRREGKPMEFFKHYHYYSELFLLSLIVDYYHHRIDDWWDLWTMFDGIYEPIMAGLWHCNEPTLSIYDLPWLLKLSKPYTHGPWSITQICCLWCQQFGVLLIHGHHNLGYPEVMAIPHI